MKTPSQSTIAFLIIGVLALLLFSYVAIRSSTVCFTIDEAFTFQRYVKNSSWFPLEYDMHTANFHMLNTWLMILSSKLFGIAEWALRLPNVLAYGIYLFFTAKFAGKSKQAWSMVAVFIVLNVHPYMIDFFSVARGYGLLIGFLAGSLWYLCEFFSRGKQVKHLALTLLFAGLAMWANFSGLTVFLGMALLVFIGVISDKNIVLRRKLFSVTIIAALFIPFVAVSYYVIAQMQEANAFFWGSDGFWDETVRVLGAKLAYPLTSDIYTVARASTGVMLLVLLLPAVIVTFAIIRNRRSFFSGELFLLLAVLLIVLIQAAVQHVVFQAPYPSGRTALFVYVIFLWILAAAIRDTMLPKRASQITSGIFAGVLFFMAVSAFNFSKTSEWNYCADVERALQDVVADTPGDDLSGGVVLGHDPEFGNILSYYLQKNKLTKVALLRCSESEDPFADYYLVSPYVKHNLVSMDTIGVYQPSGLHVLENPDSPRKTAAAMEIVRAGKIALNDESGKFELVSYTVPETEGGYARLDVTGDINCSQEQSQCVFEYWHKRGDSLVWSGYLVVDAAMSSQSTTHIISRNFPVKAASGDVFSITVVPAEPVTGPIELSQIRSQFRLSR